MKHKMIEMGDNERFLSMEKKRDDRECDFMTQFKVHNDYISLKTYS
jgi:hypothetical protein